LHQPYTVVKPEFKGQQALRERERGHVVGKEEEKGRKNKPRIFFVMTGI